MASLMENLIEVLDKEYDEYTQLLELSKKKTSVIVSGNLTELLELTEKEQEKSTVIANLERSREEVMKDIGIVLNIPAETLRLTELKNMLSSRPEEQAALAGAIDKLKTIAQRMKRVNEQNKILLENALDMVNFDLGLIQAMRQAPETANYNKGAYSAGSIMGTGNGMFDAKQ